jgi:hypothetical protein
MSSDTTSRLSGIRSSLAVKAPVRVATTANITLSGYQTLDGVTLASSDYNLRVLVKNQTTASENGIYNATSGNWTRAKDFDGNDDVVQGTRVYVLGGTSGIGEWFVSSSDPITIDSSSIAFSRNSSIITSIAATAPAAGFTIAGSPITSSGTLVFTLANDLAALEGLSSTGFAVRTTTDTWAQRSFAAPAAGFTITNNDGVSGNPTFVLANDLAALEGLASTGFAVRTTTDTWAQRSLANAAAGLTWTNGDGVSGNPTPVFANDLGALEGLSSTGFAVRSASDTWVQRSLANAAAGLTWTNGDGVSGNPTPVLANDLAALEGLDSTGFATRTAADTWAQRTLTGTANEITVTNGDGVSGAPTFSLPTALTFTGKTVTGGTFSGVAFTGGHDIQQAFTLSGDLSDTISASQDNYSPTNFSTNTIIRVDGGAASRDITGLAGGADGLVKIILNVGTSNNIVLKDSTTSTAANQFKLGSDVTMTPSQGAILWYDSTSSRWRLLGAFTSGGGGGGSVSSVGSGFGMNFSTITSSGSVALNAGVSAYAQGAL